MKQRPAGRKAMFLKALADEEQGRENPLKLGNTPRPKRKRLAAKRPVAKKKAHGTRS